VCGDSKATGHPEEHRPHWTQQPNGGISLEERKRLMLFLLLEALAKLLKARGNRHSGQAKRDPESRIPKRFWIPAFAGMTEYVTFA
jgi:hypothetical protein